MSRQDKGSRLRRLPPSIQLQLRDALTGSYPVTSRFSTDGRTGIYNTHFHDQRTVVFTSSNIYFTSYGLPGDSIYLNAYERFAQELSGTMTAVMTTGSVRSQVVEGMPYMTFPIGQELTPFRDSGQPAVDGKSSNSAFFATGSAELLIGEGFSSPLWSKNKIEIDVSVPIECGSDLYMSGHGYGLSVPADSAIGVSYEMLYFNFTSKTWQGIGKGISHGSTHYGKDFSGITSSPVPFEDMAMIGFSPSIISQYIDNSINQVSGAFEQQAGAGEPFTNLGFPWHPKFHATSSQICNMSQYINAPFLVEKIVVELSAAYSISNDVYSLTTLTNSYNSITNLTQSTVPAAINNFFILNQRNPSSFFHMENMRAYGNDAVITSSIPTNIVLAKNSQETYVDTVRDILTWGGISSFANNMPSSVTRGGAAISYSASTLPVLTMNPKQLMTRDCVFSSPLNVTTDLTPLSWAGSVYMALPAKSPKMIDSNDIDIAKSKCFSELSVVADETGGEPDSRLYLKFGGGGRDALGITIPNGRNFISPISEITTIGGIKNSFNVNQYIITTDDRYRYNPYILFPTDNLIFGWQQPLISKIMYSVALPDKNFIPGIFSSIRFLPGEAKVTLYGSYISNDKEHNDGTNQLLSSNSVHEVIGSE